jgi:aldehyde:ferredoxin oxidoreductase
MLALVTGWNVTGKELKLTARRIVTAKKLFNIQAGWTASEDTLPPRMLRKALPGDAQASLSASRLQQLIAAYYAARGWSDTGTISDESLEMLGLQELRSLDHAASVSQEKVAGASPTVV